MKVKTFPYTGFRQSCVKGEASKNSVVVCFLGRSLIDSPLGSLLVLTLLRCC